MSGSYPADVANQALAALGLNQAIGDLEEGSDLARILLRHYTPSLQQLHRTAHWSFCRKQSVALLLADATGATSGVSTIVQLPWIYAYSMPPDCMQMRFVPLNYQSSPGTPSGNIAISTAPLLATGNQPWYLGQRLVPAPFLVASDFNYPTNPSANEQYGVAPGIRQVILTNVQNAQLVYTTFVPYPTMWDPGFREAFVSYLASQVALAVVKNGKAALAVRDDQIKIAKEKISEARAQSARESGFPMTIDSIPDWIRTRASGASWGGAGYGGYGAYSGPGCLYGAWAGLSLANGSVY